MTIPPRSMTIPPLSEAMHQPTTRDQILQAAWEIILAHGDRGATMGAVAKRAGLSRQTLYLHFQDRSDLLVELVAHGDRQRGQADWRERVETVQGGEQRLRALVTAYHDRFLLLAPIIQAVESARYRDKAAATAHERQVTTSAQWIDRHIIGQLADEGRLHPSWERNEAVSLIAGFLNFRGWEHFTVDFSIPPARFVDLATCSILSSLATALPTPQD
jgi:AcrR family transcriptional regulator